MSCTLMRDGPRNGVRVQDAMPHEKYAKTEWALNARVRAAKIKNTAEREVSYPRVN